MPVDPAGERAPKYARSPVGIGPADVTTNRRADTRSFASGAAPVSGRGPPGRSSTAGRSVSRCPAGKSRAVARRRGASRPSCRPVLTLLQGSRVMPRCGGLPTAPVGALNLDVANHDDLRQPMGRICRHRIVPDREASGFMIGFALSGGVLPPAMREILPAFRHVHARSEDNVRNGRATMIADASTAGRKAGSATITGTSMAALAGWSVFGPRWNSGRACRPPGQGEAARAWMDQGHAFRVTSHLFMRQTGK